MKHVDQSFRTAWALAEGQPINARHSLLAALIVSRTTTSSAFSMLASLLPLSELDKSPTKQTSSTELGALPLNSHLAAALSVAEPFLLETKGRWVWGRDYVTWALLADKDPSLQEIAKEAGSTLETIQDKWYRFVTSDSAHRSAESWTKWWRSAGVRLPDERAQNLEDKAGATARSTKRAESVETEHETYLLTWNPTHRPFSDFAEIAQQVTAKGESTSNESIGLRTHFSVGDRVFLMRQSKDRPGLVGSGHIASSVFEDWARIKGVDGKESNWASVRWDTLREFPLVPLEELIERTGEKDLWTNQGSGFHIKPAIAEPLESVWKEARSRQEQEIPPAPLTTETVAPLAWVDTDAIPVIGDLREYQPSKHDSLDAEAQAKIFATLLVAEKVRPPLALGLLGDWGVGKTFFMRLMQETVASIAGKGARAESSSDSVSRAAQIEFNAWHYVDSDLWASLASHIFDGLSEELRGPNDTVEKIRRRLRRAIRSSQREQEEATAAIDAAQEERQAAARELENKQAERARVAASYESHRLKRVWQAVLKVKPDPNKSGESDWPNVSELKEKAERVAERLGITDAIDSVEEVQRVYNSMRELSRRGTGLATAFAAAFTGKRAWISGGVVVVVLALVIVWPWILGQIETGLGVSEETVTKLLAPLLQLGTVVGVAAAWATKNLKSISSAMGYLEQLQDEIREPRIRLADAPKEEKKLKVQIEEIDADVAMEQRRIEEADRQISEAQAEIQRINTGGLVYDFLEGRVRDSRYLDRLGLISVIRQDFEELGTLLRDWRKHGASTDSEEAAPSEESWDTRPIQRIILYIDDLDRCPPKRVVEVLQAVHLILAFDLFVVVVAVDACWLERSLNEAYNPWTATQDGSPSEKPVHRFSAHNYLEKIFQIPFSLPVMDKEGYRKLVVDMIATPRTQAERAEAERLRKEKERAEATKKDEPRQVATLTTGDKEAPTPTDEETTEHERREAEEQGQREEEERRLEQEKQEQEESERRKREQEEASKRIEAMLLDKCEEQFIAALFRFINTPRLAKRFVNIYRLIRVRAATLEKDFSSFIDRERGEYRAALMLLAISVGRADVAPEILYSLLKPNGSSFRTWIESTSTKYEQMRSRLSKERIAQSNKTEATASPSSREIRLAELRDASLEIHKSIDTVIEALNELENGPSFDDRLETYRKWAREVGRFSFRWHLREDA
jgi:hypothetical protein